MTTMTPQSWAHDLLTKMNLPVTKNNVTSILAWEYQEGGHFQNKATYNPLNTTRDCDKYPKVNDLGNGIGVCAYPNERTGLAKTTATLALPAYAKVRQDLKNDADPSKTVSDIKASPWGTWKGQPTGPVLNRARSEVAKNPSWYDKKSARTKDGHGTKSDAASGGKKKKSGAKAQRGGHLSVQPDQVQSLLGTLELYQQAAGSASGRITGRLNELGVAGLGNGGARTVPDTSKLVTVNRHVEEALGTAHGSAGAAAGLGRTHDYASKFLQQILAADGGGNGSSSAGGVGKKQPKYSALGPDGAARRKTKTPLHRSGSSRSAKIKRMLALARKQHEVEKGDNVQKYGKWYGDNGVAWCAEFVSYVFAKSGNHLPAIQGKNGFEGVGMGSDYAKAHGQLRSKPKAGDIFLYGYNKHTGIVSKVYPDGSFDTIEGNAGPNTDRVIHSHHALSSDYKFWRFIH